MKPRLLDQENVEVIRASGATTYDDAGQPVAAADDVPIVVGCNLQPLPGKEIDQLPESDRRTQMLAMYSDFAVKLKDEVVRFPGTPEETTYEVLKEGDWKNYPAMRATTHFRCIIGMNEAQ